MQRRKARLMLELFGDEQVMPDMNLFDNVPLEPQLIMPLWQQSLEPRAMGHC